MSYVQELSVIQAKLLLILGDTEEPDCKDMSDVTWEKLYHSATLVGEVVQELKEEGDEFEEHY